MTRNESERDQKCWRAWETLLFPTFTYLFILKHVVVHVDHHISLESTWSTKLCWVPMAMVPTMYLWHSPDAHRESHLPSSFLSITVIGSLVLRPQLSMGMVEGLNWVEEIWLNGDVPRMQVHWHRDILSRCSQSV